MVFTRYQFSTDLARVPNRVERKMLECRRLIGHKEEEEDERKRERRHDESLVQVPDKQTWEVFNCDATVTFALNCAMCVFMLCHLL